MPVLAFKVQADWEKVVRLREEIKKLKAEMKGIDAVNSPHQFNTLNQRLRQCTSEFNSLTNEAIKAGAQIEGGFKKKIYDAQQGVNGLTEKMIAQRAVIKQIQDDVKSLGDAYRRAINNGQNTKAATILPDYNRAKRTLEEEKYALFELTQERSKAQLSVKKLREEYQLFAKDSDAGTDALAKMKSQIIGMGKGLLAGMGLKELGAEIIRVRGQFQQADAAIATLLGSEERAKDLLSQVREYAKISPLEFGDITAATQMMLGFNIEAEKVPGFIRAIGDVSMGESGKFNSLTLAFSQMSATGKLMGQDLNQMINAGFNPLSVMAEKTGKSIAQLKEEMSKGAITSEMVQQAFIDATSAGGKFFNMSENAAKTINGQISMMHDAIDSALNDIGTASEGMIVGSISLITKLIESYETVGRVVMGLATTYGFYRTAVALVTFAENGHTLAMTMASAQILLTQKAQALLNATMLANPYVLAATALGSLVAAMVTMESEQDRVNKATEEYNKHKQEAIEKEEEHERWLNKLTQIAGDESLSTDTRRKALVQLEQKYPAIFAKYDTEIEKLSHIRDLNAEIAVLEGRASIKNPANELASIDKRIKELTDKGATTYAIQTTNWGSVRYQSGGRSETEEAELKSLKQRREQLAREVQKDKGNTYLANLTGITNDDLKRQIKERKNLLAQMQMSDKKYGKVKQGGATGTFTADELQGQLQILESEQNRRNKGNSETKQSLTERKKNLQAQLEALKEEEAAGRKGADLRRKIAEIDKRLKVYSTSGKTGTGNKEANAAERMADLRNKQQLAEQRAAKDLEFSTREAEIKAMQDGTAKKLAQIELDRQRELEAISRSYEDIRVKRIEEAKRVWDADPKNKGKNFYDSQAYQYAASQDRYTKEEKANKAEREKAVQAEYVDNISKLTSEYQSAIDQRAEKFRKYNEDIKAMTELRNKAESEGNAEAVRGLDERIRLAKLLQSLSQVDEGEESYMLNYGTWSQKLEATNSQYQRRIDEANARQDTGLAKSLQKEWEDAVAQLKLDELKENIHWDVVFGDLSKATNAQLAKVKKQVKAFMNGAEFKKMSKEGQKALTDAFKNITDASDQRNPFTSFTESLDEYGRACDDVKAAQDAYNKAVEDGTDAQKEAAKATLDTAKETKQLAQLKLAQSIGNVANEVDKYAQAASKVEGMFKSFENIDTNGGVSSVLGGVSQALGGISEAWQSLLKLDIAGIVSGAVDVVAGTVKTVANLGGMLHVFSSADYSGYNDMVDRYNNLIDVWDKLLDAKTEYINMSYGPEAVKAGKEAEGIIQKEIQAWRNLGKERLNSGASTGSHSIGVRSRKNMNDSDWRDVARSLGRSTDNWAGLGGRLEGLFSLSSEQLEKLRNDAPEFWAKLDGDVQDYLNKIIEGAEKIEDIQEKVREQMTSTTFDALKNSFAEALYDMEGTAEQRGQKIKDALFKSIVDNFILGKEFDTWLESFYEKWADKIGKGQDNMSSYDWDSYTKEYNDMLEKKIAERDRWAAAMGYTGSTQSQQSATSNAIQNITQDQANALEGRLTATQIAVEQGNTKKDETNAQLTLTNMTLADLRSVAVEHREIADDTRDILANSYLELREANEHLGEIEKVVNSINDKVTETHQIIDRRL